MPGQPFPEQPYAGQPYAGQPESGQPFAGQPYAGQPMPGQPFPGQPVAGQPYAGQPVPGQPYAYYPPYGMPPPPPRRRRKLLVGIISAVVLVLALITTVGILATRSNNGHATAGSKPSTAASSTAAPAAKVTNLDIALTAQSKALLAGDEPGWMATVDPSATAAFTEYQRIFHNLQHMKIASWTQAATNNDVPVTDTASTYSLQVDYCLLTIDCAPMHATLTITAALVAGQVRIETFTVPTRDIEHASPLPWLVSNLSTAVGPRVIVAGSSAEQGRLASALKSAEQAAAVADKFAHWGKPQVYLVYLADAAEAKLWLGSVDHPNLYTGFTATLSDTDMEGVLFMPGAADDAGPGGLTETTQWLFGNMALSYGAGGTGNDTLSAGLSDYVSTYGHASWAANTVSGGRAYVRSGKWNKNVYLTTELSSSNDTTRWGADAIGFLTIRHLISRFGLSKTLDFWGDLEREGYTLENASSLAFNVAWASVNKDCVNYVEHSV